MIVSRKTSDPSQAVTRANSVGSVTSAASARCARDGAFRTAVAPGTYFAVAEGTFEGTAVFAYSGQNPVRVERGERWLGMKTVPKEEPQSSPGPPGRGRAFAP